MEYNVYHAFFFIICIINSAVFSFGCIVSAIAARVKLYIFAKHNYHVQISTMFVKQKCVYINHNLTLNINDINENKILSYNTI